ncbi:MAG: hypothetical protein M9942_00600 [Microthrixaceae bacterium]|nr:hypothetical protein [Microthrixaceae bacterium]
MAASVLVLALLAGACGARDDRAGAQPEANEPAKLTVAGDSIALGLGVTLRDLTDAAEGLDGDPSTSAVETKVIAQDGTGLARPDVFDWPERLEQLAAEFPPEVLVFSVGSNDTQDLTDPDGGVVATLGDPEAWDTEYSARLAEVFDHFADTDTTVVWLGHIRPEADAVADGNRHIHELASQVASERPWVEVGDLAVLTGSGAVETSGCLAPDGLHLRTDCYVEASEQLLDSVRTALADS